LALLLFYNFYFYKGNCYNFNSIKISIYKGFPNSELICEITDRKEIDKIINMIKKWNFNIPVTKMDMIDENCNIIVRFNENTYISIKSGKPHAVISNEPQSSGRVVYIPLIFFNYIKKQFERR